MTDEEVELVVEVEGEWRFIYLFILPLLPLSKVNIVETEFIEERGDSDVLVDADNKYVGTRQPNTRTLTRRLLALGCPRAAPQLT